MMFFIINLFHWTTFQLGVKFMFWQNHFEVNKLFDRKFEVIFILVFKVQEKTIFYTGQLLFIKIGKITNKVAIGLLYIMK